MRRARRSPDDPSQRRHRPEQRRTACVTALTPSRRHAPCCPPGMLQRALISGLLLASALSAQALTLDDIHVKATLVDGSPKDSFRIRGRLGHADTRALVKGFAMVRFGALEAQAPAGGFVRRGSVYTWRSYLLGVKKVTINVKKGTLNVVEIGRASCR